MTPPSDPTQAGAFLNALWPSKPPAAAVQLWEKRTKKTATFADLDHAARYGTEQAGAGDVYVAAGLAAKESKPSSRRAGSAEVVAIPGLWADLDVNGGPEHKTTGAPSTDEAIELAQQLLEPTLLVASGYGIQAWWLFEDPWIFDGEHGLAARDQAARLSAAFTNALRAAAAERLNTWKLDGTFDLARLMRLPGTLNHKGVEPVAVQQLEHDGPRHDLGAFQGIVAKHMRSAGDMLARGAGGDVDISLNGSGWPAEKIVELCEITPDFDAVWNHRPSNKTDTWSLSEYDLSIGTFLANAGLDDQEIADALRHHRKRFDDGSGKGERVDYIKRTIAKARSGEKHHAQTEREIEAERTDTLQQIAEVATSNGAVENSAEVVISLFARLVGGPQIKELVQEGRDPTNTRFKIVLADGTDVPLGDVNGLVNQRSFRNSFAVVTGHYPRMVKATKHQTVSWDDLVRALLKAATVNDHPEDARASLALEHVAGYCENRLSTDRDAACELGDPFEDDGYVHIYLQAFVQWLRKARGVRVDDVDLKIDLQAAGFERKAVNYHRQDKTRTTRSYFRAPVEIIKGATIDG